MQTPVQQLIQQGISAGSKGDKRQALTHLQAAVRQDKSQAEAWYWLGVFTEEKPKREECLKRALSLRPDDSRALKLLAELQDMPVATFEELLTASTSAADFDDDAFITLADPKSDDPFADMDMESVQPARATAPVTAGAPARKTATQPMTTAASAKKIVTQTVAAATPAQKTTTQPLPAAAPARKTTTQPMAVVGTKTIKVKRDARLNWGSVWVNALRFNSDESFEQYRPVARAGQASLMLSAGYLITLCVLGTLTYLVSLSGFSWMDDATKQRQAVLFLVGGALFSAIWLLATYFASYATAYLARTHYDSHVSGDEHYALTSVAFAPGSVLTGLLVLFSALLANFSNHIIWDSYNYSQSSVSATVSPFVYTLASFLSVTLFMTWLVYTVYLVGQYIFSVVAIHRVKMLPGFVLALVFIGVQLLVIVWILPFLFGLMASIPA